MLTKIFQIFSLIFSYNRQGLVIDKNFRLLITTIIAPHGITDILEKDFWGNIKYHLILLLCIIMDLLIPIRFKFPLLTLSSIYHLSFDTNMLISSFIHFLTIVVLPDPHGLYVFILYMIFWHVPYHYYTHLKFKHLSIVILFSLAGYLIGNHDMIYEYVIRFTPVFGIIWCHIINQYLEEN